MGRRRPRVVAFGYFGMGNLGNEASLAALVAHVRDTAADVDLTCLSANGEATTRQHGTPAVALMTLASRRRRLPWHVAKAFGRVWDVPRTLWLLRDVDLVVVPGMGVLESSLGTRPWGMPYWLLVATVSSRARGAKVALVSVGVAVPRHPVTRRFFRWTLALAHFRSYRDGGSRSAAGELGVRGELGPVRPDLAFAAPPPAVLAPRPGHVVVGVMAYEGEPHTPGRGPALVRAYADRMVTAVGRLVDDGRSVSLVVGDLADRWLAEEIASRVSDRRHAARGAVIVSPALTMHELMVEMSSAEVVVASRFHNLLAGLKVGRPTVSLSYAPKHRELQAAFGLPGMDQPIDTFDVDTLLEHLAQAAELPPETCDHLRSTAERCRQQVDAQFHEVFSLLDARR